MPGGARHPVALCLYALGCPSLGHQLIASTHRTDRHYLRAQLPLSGRCSSRYVTFAEGRQSDTVAASRLACIEIPIGMLE